RGLHGVPVARVDQTLEHYPAVRAGLADVPVAGQVDPAETAVRERAEDLVPVVDQVTGGQARGERVRRPVPRTEALGTSGLPVASAADRLAARPAEALRLRPLRAGQARARRVPQRPRRPHAQAGAEPAAPPGATAATGTRAGPGRRLRTAHGGRHR